jgi:hypothetical protein
VIELHPEILTKDGKPQFVVLPYEEFLEVREALARLAEQQMADPKYGAATDNLSAHELARRQGVGPTTGVDELYGAGDAADWEGFDQAVVRWRNESGTL